MLKKFQRFTNKLSKNQKIILTSIVFFTFVGFTIIISFFINRQNNQDTGSDASQAPLHSQINPTRYVETLLESEIKNDIIAVRVYGKFSGLNEILGGEIFLKYESNKLDLLANQDDNVNCSMAVSPSNILAARTIPVNQSDSLVVFAFDRNKFALSEEIIEDERTCLVEYKFRPKISNKIQTFVFELVSGKGEGNTTRFIQYDGGYDPNLTNHYLIYVNGNSPIETRILSLEFIPQVVPNPSGEPTPSVFPNSTLSPTAVQQPVPPDNTSVQGNQQDNSTNNPNTNNSNNSSYTNKASNQQGGSLTQNSQDQINKKDDATSVTPTPTAKISPTSRLSPTPTSKTKDATQDDIRDVDSKSKSDDGLSSENAADNNAGNSNIFTNPLFVGASIFVILLIIGGLIYLLLRTMSSEE